MGTGLGLAIVKHIMNRHRGGFFVESAPDHGASFCVYLALSAKAVKLGLDIPAAAAASGVAVQMLPDQGSRAA